MNPDAFCIAIFAIPLLIIWWHVLSGGAEVTEKSPPQRSTYIGFARTVRNPHDPYEIREVKQGFFEDRQSFLRREDKYISQQLKEGKHQPKTEGGIPLGPPPEIKFLTAEDIAAGEEARKLMPTGEDVRRVYVLPTLVLSVVMPLVVNFVLTGGRIGAGSGFTGFSIGVGLIIAAALGIPIAQAIAREDNRTKARSTDSSK